MSQPTFILTNGDEVGVDKTENLGHQATEDQNGTAQLVYLACQTFMDLQFIQQLKNLPAL